MFFNLNTNFSSNNRIVYEILYLIIFYSFLVLFSVMFVYFSWVIFTGVENFKNLSFLNKELDKEIFYSIHYLKCERASDLHIYASSLFNDLLTNGYFWDVIVNRSNLSLAKGIFRLVLLTGSVIGLKRELCNIIISETRFTNFIVGQQKINKAYIEYLESKIDSLELILSKDQFLMRADTLKDIFFF